MSTFAEIFISKPTHQLYIIGMKQEIYDILEDALPLVDLDSDFLFAELSSLDITTIMMLLSEKYGITLDSHDVSPKNFKTLDSIVALVESKLS